jgi:type IV pilus biogenesis protein CpaD/CtpE
LAGLLLVGCKLIDQTTFAPSPEEVATKQEAPKVDARTPLLTIGVATPEAGYQDMLRYAVRAAETRVPGVQYDVVAMLPAGANEAGSQQLVAAVMRDIMAQGVPASRIRLGLRSAPAGSAQEVRVYVR